MAMTLTAGDYKLPQNIADEYWKRGVNPYSEQNFILVRQIHEGLENALALYGKQQEDAALKGLEALVPALLMGKLMGARMKDNYASDERNAHTLADILIRCTANILEHQEKIRDLIKSAEIKLSGDQKRIVQDQVAMAQLRDKMAQLQHDIDDFRDRCEEAEKWSWVPGYNVYLAGRTLADAINGKFQELDSNRAELQRYGSEANKDQTEMAQLSASVAKMQAETATWADQEKKLIQQQAVMEAQIAFYSKRTVFASDIALFFANAGIAIDSLSDNLDSMMAIASRLQERVKIYNLDGSVTEGSLKEALQVAGKSADRWNAQHQHW
jgi:predicted  nucleic acid-binding Zn-ribbon protein